ncbi:MAG: hypothetical protein ACI8R4_002687 [Paracoccaceae bacterium]|jgi:hypothetical protein
MFRPFIKRQVAGDERGSTLIALRDQLEQKFRASFAEDAVDTAQVQRGPAAA